MEIKDELNILERRLSLLESESYEHRSKMRSLIFCLLGLVIVLVSLMLRIWVSTEKRTPPSISGELSIVLLLSGIAILVFGIIMFFRVPKKGEVENK